MLEHALLRIVPGREARFELAFTRAQAVVSRAEGFLGLELWRSIEESGAYRLLIRWESVEAHMVGFRESELFGEWVRLLRDFYAAPAAVDHGTLVAVAAPPTGS